MSRLREREGIYRYYLFPLAPFAVIKKKLNHHERSIAFVSIRAGVDLLS